MKTSDFTYQLPADRIAKYPPKERGQSRLLVLSRENGQIEHRNYSGLIDYLVAGDLLVINNTKVVKARLELTKPNGKLIEVLLVEKHGTEAQPKQQPVIFKGKLQPGEVLAVGGYQFQVEHIDENGVAFLSGEVSLWDIAGQFGQVPIPPYLNRLSEEIDEHRYQTVFAQDPGSVAAPTASLNFTSELLQQVRNRGVRVATLTLHVGLGTFLPIRVEELSEHHMHSEFYYLPTETVELIRQAKRERHHVVAVGTTVARALEHGATKILGDQVLGKGGIEDEADLFIYPGYRFKIVDRLLTNFHAPRSTVLMLAAAFAGWETLKRAYLIAVEEKYRFLSYGDSMFIL